MSQTLHTLRYNGKIGGLYKIWVINVLLSIVTLGIYAFWGKTRTRRYIAACTQLHQDRFEYTGTGGELFRGFLRAIPILIVVYLPFMLFDPNQDPWVSFFALPIFILYFAGMYAAMRYRLSRTIWRGIRGHLGGSAFGYAFRAIGCTIANVFTLGLFIPYFDMVLYRYFVGHAKFGSQQATFVREGSLTRVHIITWLLALPTAMLSRFWYRAALLRHQYGCTHIGSIHLQSTYTGGSLLWLFFSNLFILTFTFGFGTPIVIHRNMRYFTSHTHIAGELDSLTVAQSAEPLKHSGEGLETAFGAESAFM